MTPRKLRGVFFNLYFCGMAKNKLKRFNENHSFPNVIEPSREEALDGFELKGKWNSSFFKNDLPIILELGCGKGEYTIGLAEENPDAVIVCIICDRGDRYLSTGLFSVQDPE